MSAIGRALDAIRRDIVGSIYALDFDHVAERRAGEAHHDRAERVAGTLTYQGTARVAFDSIDTDDLARVLRHHAVDIEDWGNIRCACADTAWFDTAEEHREHAAEAVKAHLLGGERP